MQRRIILWIAIGVSIATALASCSASDSDVSESGGGRSATDGGSSGSGGERSAVGGGGVSSGGSSTGGSSAGGSSAGGEGPGLRACDVSQNAILCESVSLEMPPQVTLRADSGPWDTTMQGEMAPGTYVLTDLAKHGESPSCSRTLSAIYVFGADGRFAHGWDEGGQSIRYSGTYEDGPVDGTVKTTVECPAGAATGSGGIAFRMTESGFTVTNNDGAVYTFTRR